MFLWIFYLIISKGFIIMLLFNYLVFWFLVFEIYFILFENCIDYVSYMWIIKINMNL